MSGASPTPARGALHRGRLRTVLTTAVAVLFVSGCAVNGLSFVRDTRVRILTPEANETVHLPLEIRWSAEDVDGKFVVFFDRSPMRPGQTLLSLVSKNDPCRAERDCPDIEWLADRDIYVTERTTLRVDRLADRRDTSRARDRHDLTIVLLDNEGRRAGESAFTREFIVDREN